MTTTATQPSAAKRTPHDIHHLLLTEAERVADLLSPTTLRMIRVRHQQRFPDCPTTSRERG